MRLCVAAIFIVVMMSVLPVAISASQIEEQENFKKYNPDGKKYEFVKDYITSLGYLRLNAERVKEMAGITATDLADQHRTQSFLDRLILDNANLRIARNFLKKYKTIPQGLMIKVTTLFESVCDQQIEFNSLERVLLEKSVEKFAQGKMSDPDMNEFITALLDVSQKRREAFTGLLEASLLVNKVLLAESPDLYGEYRVLGITRDQRRKLLFKLDDFSGEQYRGGLREGQTFLEGSVAVIYDVLNDYYKWDTLD